MAQVTNPSVNPVARRRSQRVLVQVGVRIRGENPQGTPFEEETDTLAINAHGALILLQARVTSGSKALMKHKRTEEEQACPVVFLGPVRSGKADLGMELSWPRATCLGVPLPAAAWRPWSPAR